MALCWIWDGATNGGALVGLFGMLDSALHVMQSVAGGVAAEITRTTGSGGQESWRNDGEEWDILCSNPGHRGMYAYSFVAAEQYSWGLRWWSNTEPLNIAKVAKKYRTHKDTFVRSPRAHVHTKNIVHFMESSSQSVRELAESLTAFLCSKGSIAFNLHPVYIDWSRQKRVQLTRFSKSPRIRTRVVTKSKTSIFPLFTLPGYTHQVLMWVLLKSTLTMFPEHLKIIHYVTLRIPYASFVQSWHWAGFVALHKARQTAWNG